MKKEILIKVPGDHEYMKVCRSVITAVASIKGLDIDQTDDLGMAVFEATKVLACHRFDYLCEEYEMKVIIEDDKLTIIMKVDSEFNKKKTKTICLDCPCEGDISRAVVDTIMDKTELIEDKINGDTFIMTKYL